MFNKICTVLAALILCASLGLGIRNLDAQVTNNSFSSILPNFPQSTITFTATGQTSSPNTLLGGVSYGTISVIGTGLTTATWGLKGSNDGVNFFPINTALISTPGTVATTQTTTANSMYIVNLAGLTAVQFVTSGTFTATNIKIRLVATPNKGLL